MDSIVACLDGVVRPLLKGLMPEERDTLRPTVERLFKAFADYGLVQVRDEEGQTVTSRFARLNPVQEQILKVLGLPRPAQVFAKKLANFEKCGMQA